MKYIVLLFTVLLISCNGNTQNMKTKAKDTPEVRKMREAFNNQEHRLELNGCEMLYNEKPFQLGMTIKEIEDVFGKYDVFFNGYYIWEDIGIVFATKPDTLDILSKAIYIYIYMNKRVDERDKEYLKQQLNIKKDYFLIEGTPVDKNMQFKNFISNSNYELNDFIIDNYGYKLHFNCKPDKKIMYSISCDGGWIYKGGGHLQMKSHPNPDNMNKIEEIAIYEVKEDE